MGKKGIRNWVIGLGLAVGLCAGGLWLLTSLVIDFAPASKKSPQQFSRIAAQAPGPLRKLSLTGRDGVKIAAWYLPADVAPGAEHWGIVMAHGGGDDKSYYLPLAEALRARGYDVILPDLRGAGESDPSPDGTTLGISEGRDVAAAAAWLADEQKVGHIAALGVSMGGIATVMGASLEPRIGPMILESSSYKAQRVFDYMLAQFRFPEGNVRSGFSRLLTTIGLWRMGAGWGNARDVVLPTWNLAPKLGPKAVLFIYGDRDPLVHAEDIALFRSRFRGPTRTIQARGAAHGVYKRYPENYSAAVIAFLDDWRAGRTFRSGFSIMEPDTPVR